MKVHERWAATTACACRADAGSVGYGRQVAAVPGVRYWWHEAPVPPGLEITQVYGYLLCPVTGRVLVQDDDGVLNLPGGTPEPEDGGDLAATLVREAFEESQVRVTRPEGSRRMTTSPASAVRVSRSPPRQPSAPVTVRSATRPERSTWASPYTTSRASAGGRTGGTASGKVWAAAGARAGRAAAEEGMTGAISVPVTAASRGGRRDRSARWGGRRHQPGRPRVQAVL